MNLTDLSQPVSVAVIEKQYKNQFKNEISVSNLSEVSSKRLLSKTNDMITEFKTIQKSRNYENNPTYIRLQMVKEAVTIHLVDLKENANNQQVKINEMKNNYIKALKHVAKGGSLSESQITQLNVSPSMRTVLESTVAAKSFMMKIVESKKAAKALNESEISTAQTTIAAQDIADQIQDMIAKFADIRYKELPALTDSIRGSQGVESANLFNQSVLGSLDGLTGSLEQAKGEIDNAVAGLTGESVTGDLDLGGMDDMDTGMDDMDMDDDLGIDNDMAPEDDLGDDFDLDFGDEADAEEEIDLGRSRR